MATNRVREHATRIALPVPEGTKSGDPLMIGDLPCVAVVDEGEWTEGEASVQTDGSFKLAISGSATAGDAVYLHAGPPVTLSTTVGGDNHFGYVLEDADDNEVEVKVGY